MQQNNKTNEKAFLNNFIRCHLEYADIIYNKPFNNSFKEKLANVQYSAVLIITGAIKDTS